MNDRRQQMHKLDLKLGKKKNKPIESGTTPSRNSRLEHTDVFSLGSTLGAKSDEPVGMIENVIIATFDRADLNVGKSFLDIQHCRNLEDRHKPYYSTKITNRSTQKIRIDRFGTYTKRGDLLVLHSITGGFFSCQQFQEWYDLGQSQWIEPGQVVTDPNNHSNLGVYWTYFATTASGEKFVAGAAWLGIKPWWKLW
jgi:hypothetical protein